MKRGQKRIIVVPPALSSRTQAPYPQTDNASLYVVHLDRVKRNPNKSATKGREEESMMPLPDIGEVKRKRQSSVAATPVRRQEK
jgi:hypothetical protein